MSRVVHTVVAALFALALSPGAAASPRYSSDLRRLLDLSYEPACTLCHSQSSTVTTPFGRALESRGLRVDDPHSLEAALDRLHTDGVDSDGDGAEDLDELAWHGDPNAPDLPSGPELAPPAYGCAVARGAAPASRPIGVLGLTLALTFLRRRPAEGTADLPRKRAGRRRGRRVPLLARVDGAGRAGRPVPGAKMNSKVPEILVFAAASRRES